ncbi:MAG: hypothetical protein L6R39_005975 [Caloplaca ligustica]|nr:MAG: hypothetical protein L6R39_005975 [Caloplaca ligustica]
MAKLWSQFSFITAIAWLAWVTHSQARPSPSDNKQNGTITDESDGTRVWCQPSQWYDVVWFIFTNFVLHALSVRSLPGERSFTSIVFKFCCFLTPFTGVRRGLCLILRASNLAGNDLQSAARANALCMVIRGPEWRPKDEQIIEGCRLEVQEHPEKKEPSVWRRWLLCSARPKATEKSKKVDPPEISTFEPKDIMASPTPHPTDGTEVKLKTTDLYAPPAVHGLVDKLTRVLVETYRFQSTPPTRNIVDHDNVKIHGVCQLAPGYALSYIPEDIKIYSHVKHQRTMSISRLLGMNHVPDIKLASTHDVPRILFSLIQTVSGGYSVYKARGSQIERHGYAAYGLTVIPYMMVSIINLIGSLLTSEYETIYMVHSAVMDEMKGRGGLCDGVVGTIERPEHQTYVHIEGEEETKPEGQKMQFTSTGGEVRCQDLTEKSTTKELHVSHWNHIEPVKAVWLFQKWGRNRRKAEEKGPPSTTQTQLLCVPSHSGFTRLSRRWSQTCLNTLTLALLVLALGLPYIMIAILSGWRTNHSTSMHRTFVTNWLICGQLQGWAVSYVEAASGMRTVMRGLILIFVSYGSYSIMGLVVVVQEMIESGTCKALS